VSIMDKGGDFCGGFGLKYKNRGGPKQKRLYHKGE
jgi:hypothetical protein